MSMKQLYNCGTYKNGIHFELFWSVIGQNGNEFPTHFQNVFIQIMG